ncbi:hypothetical protein BDV38DRAFT_78049 [Aspergillus pseudotamarii]|uniref:Uncharacterized protein n=1 Tax=Aspergillus pseudotamarii TaxID=132259 RepID=A0A5N6SY75_ASPPS|nr:uncharacterized protein BDV38DRAFT_78049 [Aspergillus pseudotamarii]KAE8138074.1 hypothetical protein BDV38DRAFT_78049 [Aspergillus pseudotamarii]
MSAVRAWHWYCVHVCMFVHTYIQMGQYSILGAHRTSRGISTVPSHRVPTGLSRTTDLGYLLQNCRTKSYTSSIGIMLWNIAFIGFFTVPILYSTRKTLRSHYPKRRNTNI